MNEQEGESMNAIHPLIDSGLDIPIRVIEPDRRADFPSVVRSLAREQAGLGS